MGTWAPRQPLPAPQPRTFLLRTVCSFCRGLSIVEASYHAENKTKLLTRSADSAGFAPAAFSSFMAQFSPCSPSLSNTWPFPSSGLCTSSSHCMGRSFSRSSHSSLLVLWVSARPSLTTSNSAFRTIPHPQGYFRQGPWHWPSPLLHICFSSSLLSKPP